MIQEMKKCPSYIMNIKGVDVTHFNFRFGLYILSNKKR